MAKAHYLTDKDGNKFYPIAHADATYDRNGVTVGKRLDDLEAKSGGGGKTYTISKDTTNPAKINLESDDKTSVSSVTISASDIGALPSTTTIPTSLSDLSDDSTHRLVTDADINNWNGKTGFSGDYNDLTNKPTIPTKVSELTNDSGFTNNVGTITEIKMNGTSKGTSGVVDLGTVITSHQSLAGYATIDSNGKLYDTELNVPVWEGTQAEYTTATTAGEILDGMVVCITDDEPITGSSNFYTKDEINNMMAIVPRFTIEVVDSLNEVTTPSPTTVYLVAGGDNTGVMFTEYIYYNNAWKLLATQRGMSSYLDDNTNTLVLNM